MRGKTNILPMVGGYVNAPVGNFTAGEALQLGDLVEKAYSDLPQQIYTMTGYNPMTYAHRLYDGKFVVFSKIRFINTSPNHYESYTYLVERSATQFNVSQFTLISNDSLTPLAVTYVPMSDRIIIALIREGNGNSTPYTYSCKKITYNGVDFSVEDINCDNYPTAFNEYATKWCIGNDGTMIQIGSKIYYVTIENNSVVVFGDETSSGDLLYLPTQDVFICIGGGVYRSVKVDVVNRILTVSNDYSVDFQSANVFGDGLIGYTAASSSTSAKVKLYYATVSNEGLITVQDVWDSNVSCYVTNGYLAFQLIMFSDFFVLCRINYGNTSYGSTSFRMWNDVDFYVFYYRNGFMSGDSEGLPTINFSNGSQQYLNQANMCSILDEKGFDIMLDYSSNNSWGTTVNVIFAFQQMADDEFAGDDDGFTMVKAIHHIDGVVKSGGNTGDTVQVFVPQISS